MIIIIMLKSLLTHIVNYNSNQHQHHFHRDDDDTPNNHSSPSSSSIMTIIIIIIINNTIIIMIQGLRPGTPNSRSCRQFQLQWALPSLLAAGFNASELG